MRLGTEASPAIRVKLSSPWSQNSVLPPNPCSLIIDSAKSSPYASAFSTTFLFSSKQGMYCGDAAEMIQPLLLMGMKTPMSIRRSRSQDEDRHGASFMPRHFGKARSMRCFRWSGETAILRQPARIRNTEGDEKHRPEASRSSREASLDMVAYKQDIFDVRDLIRLLPPP